MEHLRDLHVTAKQYIPPMVFSGYEIRYVPSRWASFINKTLWGTDTSADVSFKDTYINVKLINFRDGLKEEFTHSVAVKKLLPFACTHLCETTFLK
jgi:prolipoprotein diacylglyceryltransferase